MALTASSSVPANMPPPVAVHGLHHFAWRCRDAEETRHFYEDILGLPLVHVIRAENVHSTGEYCPYVHIFFRLQDGSSMAFFDLGDDTAAQPSPNTPAWVNHIALRVASLHELEQARQRLLQHGVDVIGITDHQFVKSIYFFDPNGFRLELTVPTDPPGYIEAKASSARAECDAWSAEKARRRTR